MATRKQYTQEEQLQWLERWRTCGQSAAQFAKSHGLNVSTLYRWREVARTRGTASTRRAPAFAEVRVREASAQAGVGVVEVVLSNERRVRVVGTVELEQLRMVLEVLGAC
jgi:transposase-like protein